MRVILQVVNKANVIINDQIYNEITSKVTDYTYQKNSFYFIRDVVQLVVCVLWEHDVAGSSPVIPRFS